MAGDGAQEILREVQALVSDKLQVVSYKWLSRNFSVSSNAAKRLLKEFIDQYGNDVEVVYTLSGWLKNNPQTYCIKLAAAPNLPEVKQEFMDNCSVQVYSVQASIPKDLALLWSTEFVQAEELFKQASTTDNCLTDNRFCGVSNSYVKRTVDEKSAAAVFHLKNDTCTSLRPKTSSIPKESLPPAPELETVAKSGAKNGSSSMVNASGKNDRNASVISDQTSKPRCVNEPIAVTHTSKKKGKNETSSGGGGSLTSMWDRASVKSKSPCPDADTALGAPKFAASADAQICANEAADATSSDSEVNPKCKRKLHGASNRKRRVVMDSSDEDDEEENVVKLASSSSPTDPPHSEFVHDIGKTMDKNNLSSEEQKEVKVDVKLYKSNEGNPGLSGSNRRTRNINDITGISLQKKTEAPVPRDVSDDGDKKVNNKTTAVSTSPKRRKVLKTRIDERGREVNEVVWEGDATDNDHTDKKMSKSDVSSRPPVVNKAQTAGTNAPVNPVNKTNNKKPAKGGGKDAKQGKISSFFKKV